ncbi:MAG: 4Fe-4S dicluster domain-containing protein [Salinivirgaceae bacterium]
MWGFSITKTNTIDYDKNDKTLMAEILRLEPSIRVCIACGACTATCTAGNLTPFNIRKLNVFLQRGEYNEMMQEMGKCMLCGKCTLVCPRGVNLRNLMLKTRETLMKLPDANGLGPKTGYQAAGSISQEIPRHRSGSVQLVNFVSQNKSLTDVL